MYILFLKKKTDQQMVFNLDTVKKVFIAEYVYQILRVHQSYNEVIFWLKKCAEKDRRTGGQTEQKESPGS